MRFFSFDKCLNLICTNSISLDISEMFRTSWKSIRFKLDLKVIYNNLDCLSSLLTTSFLLQISFFKSFLWHHLYVEEERKLELPALKRKNFQMTLWSSLIFKNWRSKRAFQSWMSVFSNFLTNSNVGLPYLFLKTSATESLSENLRKKKGVWTLKLVRKFEKTDIKHKKALLNLQFLKICK